jgi:phosphohistidine phosphatase
MKILYMARHAKSSWKHDVIDHQRPLKGRGRRDGKLVSEYVAKNHKAPEKMISSDAVRALSTAKYFKKAFQVADEDFSTNHSLYDFSGQNAMEVIKNLDDSHECIMIVGHNHAFTSIVNMLGNEYIDNLPTCGFVIIEFDVEKWSDISTGKTATMVFPRHLKND